MQVRKQAVTIPLPNLGASHLCPIKAVQMIQLVSVDPNDPLFLVPRTSRPVPLTDSVARKHLKKISNVLYVTTSLTFYDFRRAGARWAFQQDVLLEHIMKHGTWKSDAVWSYLSNSTLNNNLVYITNSHVDIIHTSILITGLRVCKTPFLHHDLRITVTSGIATNFACIHYWVNIVPSVGYCFHLH